MSTSKRERSINFNREEVELLTSLIAQYKHILENKKSDAVTWHEKEQYWKMIEEKFNSTSGVNFRSAKTLKAKYEGIKRATRKKSAAIRSETYCTGDGPSTAPPLSSVEEKVKDMILLSVDGIESQFDSDHIDSTQIPQSQEINESDDVQIVIETIDEDVEQSSLTPFIIDDQPTQNVDSDDERHLKRKISVCTTPKNVDNEKWSNWKPKSLRSRKHPALCATKIKRPFERVADSKIELAELQKTILEEELINKRKQWAFEEEERQHKRELWAMEKKILANKLE